MPACLRQPAVLVLAAALGLVLAATAAWGGEPPELTVSPEEGTAGSEAQVEGVGFAERAAVRVLWQPTGEVLAAATGPAFSATVRIPADAAEGTHDIEARAQAPPDLTTGDEQHATTPFTVTSDTDADDADADPAGEPGDDEETLADESVDAADQAGDDGGNDGGNGSGDSGDSGDDNDDGAGRSDDGDDTGENESGDDAGDDGDEDDEGSDGSAEPDGTDSGESEQAATAAEDPQAEPAPESDGDPRAAAGEDAAARRDDGQPPGEPEEAGQTETGTPKPAGEGEPPSTDDDGATARGSGHAPAGARRGYATPPATDIELDTPVELADGRTGEPLEVKAPLVAGPDDDRWEAGGSPPLRSAPQRDAEPTTRRSLASARTRADPATPAPATVATADTSARSAASGSPAVSLLLLLAAAGLLVWHRWGVSGPGRGGVGAGHERR